MNSIEHIEYLANVLKNCNVSSQVPSFGPKKVPIWHASPKFHPYKEMPRQSPKSKNLDRKHC